MSKVRCALHLLAVLLCGSLAYCGEIQDAAGEGDLAKVKALLNANPALISGSDDKYGMTPLQWAASEGRLDVVQWLVSHKADVNAKAADGETAMHMAAVMGYRDVAQYLLEHGARDAQEPEGEMQEAARSGDVDKVMVLIKDRPELVFSKDSLGRTPLHQAAANGQKDMAELLLAHKAVADDADKNGWTPLHFAVSKDDKDITALLLASRADVNIRNNKGATPLHIAALRGNTAITRLLLDAGADVNARAANNGTPLIAAAALGRKDEVAMLLAAMADVNAADQQGATALRWAGAFGRKDVVKMLMAAGAKATDLSAPSRMAVTEGNPEEAAPVPKAVVAKSSPKIVSAVIAKPTPSSAKVASTLTSGTTTLLAKAAGSTPAPAAIIKSSKAIVAAPASKPAPVAKTSGTARTKAVTPAVAKTLPAAPKPAPAPNNIAGVKPSAAAIFRAARFGDVEKIKALLNADPGLVFAKDKDGLTPLHIAAWKGRAAVVELLLSHKADVNARDADGETPLHYATPASSKDVRNLLRQHGGSE